MQLPTPRINKNQGICGKDMKMSELKLCITKSMGVSHNIEQKKARQNACYVAQFIS